MNYIIERNNGLLQYRYSVVDKESGHVKDNTSTFIGALVILVKAQLTQSNEKKLEREEFIYYKYIINPSHRKRGCIASKRKGR